jgi:hypothetical protein
MSQISLEKNPLIVFLAEEKYVEISSIKISIFKLMLLA